MPCDVLLNVLKFYGGEYFGCLQDCWNVEWIKICSGMLKDSGSPVRRVWSCQRRSSSIQVEDLSELQLDVSVLFLSD